MPCPLLLHREPGLAGALLSDENAIIGLIADGIHVHPVMVRMIWQLIGSNRLSLVTDAMAALGMPPGHYLLGDYETLVDESSARLVDGTLAGSILSLDTALINLMQFTGCTIMDALPTVTANPAKLLGIADQIGALIPGFVANLVLLSPDLTLMTTVVNGEIVYTNAS